MITRKSKSIFLADDDEDDCLLFRDALKEVGQGIDLTISYDGEELMKTLDQFVPPEPEVIFLDLNMPRKNGLECLEEIKKTDKLKNIPVIIFSTSAQQEHIEKAYQHGANFYICKPGTYMQLKKTLQKVLSMDWSTVASHRPFDQFLLQP